MSYYQKLKLLLETEVKIELCYSMIRRTSLKQQKTDGDVSSSIVQIQLYKTVYSANQNTENCRSSWNFLGDLKRQLKNIEGKKLFGIGSQKNAFTRFSTMKTMITP